MRWQLVACLFTLACEGQPPSTPVCPTDEAPHIEVALRDGGFPVVDGVAIPYGMPPQGGAPFAPFRVRVWGVDPDPAGYHVLMEAVDVADGAVLGSGDYVQSFVCANVGDNTGFRVAPELHMRFYDLTLEELQGREVDVTLRLEAAEASLESAFRGTLVEEL